MKRSMCGIVLFAAAAALWSCNGDPTGSIRDEGTKVLADPSAVFVDQGSSKFVTVELVDGQGNQLASSFEPQNVGPGITVEKDTTYLETTTGSPIETSSRFIVTGAAPAATSFDLASGGQSITIPVKVTPTSATVSLSNPTPASNEGLVITLPAGYKFIAGAGADVSGTAGTVTAIAADSSSATVVFAPGTTGPITLNGVQVDFIPGVPLSVATTETVTVGPVTAAAGTDAPTTAPPIPIPAAGGTTVFYDAPDFPSAIDRFYRLDVPEAGDYTITVDWSVGSDVDAVVCADAACSAFNGQFGAATSNKPESATFTLTAGTQVLLVEDFAGDAAGATVTITITH